MNKMVNKLNLKKRFVFTITDIDDDTTTDEEVEECTPSVKTLDMSSPLSKDFVNYTVFVKEFGEKVERLVDTNKDNNPFEDTSRLDQLMGCKDINKIQSLITKSGRNSTENPKKTKNKPKNGRKCLTNTKDMNENDGLRSEGIKKNKSIYECIVCDIKFIELQTALDHMNCDKHLKSKFGDDLKGLDALFTIDCESIGDAQTAIARKRELKKISWSDKQLYYDHGIRLKDGLGDNAYICSKCNLCFNSLSKVIKHLNSFETLNDNNKQKETLSPNLNQLDIKLTNEGIRSSDGTDSFKFYCIFCNIYFDVKKTAVTHIRDPRHLRTKRGESLNEMDSNFVVESERIDEFEVAFSRKQCLKSISPTNKIHLTSEMIRLKDGMGINAYICQKCNESLETVDAIEAHIKSTIHSKQTII